MSDASPHTARRNMPSWASRLGYAGLIPFVILSAATWWAPDGYRTHAALALLGYGASIASFLGAIHWGLAMREPASASGPYWWGGFPSLVAWVALLLPHSQGLVTVAMLLCICFAVDRRTYPAYSLSEWLSMRLRLTLVAALSLLLASFAA
jgi:hypothetical protein